MVISICNVRGVSRVSDDFSRRNHNWKCQISTSIHNTPYVFRVYYVRGRALLLFHVYFRYDMGDQIVVKSHTTVVKNILGHRCRRCRNRYRRRRIELRHDDVKHGGRSRFPECGKGKRQYTFISPFPSNIVEILRKRDDARWNLVGRKPVNLKLVKRKTWSETEYRLSVNLRT